VIASLNGRDIAGSDDFIRTIGHTPIDQPAKLKVYRDGRATEIEVTPRRRPLAQVAINRETQRMRWRGLTVSSVPQNWNGKQGSEAPAGLFVVGIDDAELAKKLNLKQGSIITMVGGQAVKTIADLQKIIDSTPADKLMVQTADAEVVSAQQ
jgi:S1-C subfamily serine protease